MKNFTRIFTLFALSAAMYTAKAQTVTLDYYFNHELHADKSGQQVRFHYMWEDTTLNGYSKWGSYFKAAGAKLASLETAPTLANLKGSDVYIIVDPDSKKESPKPNYIETKDIDQIEKWVKAGGVLVMMANDSANVELPHLNNLAARFGIHFNDDIHNHVIGNNIAAGTLFPKDNAILKTAHKIYMKDISTITLSGAATAALKDGDAVIIATVKYGKGTVLAVGDPWLYNEYTNGHLPADGGYENDKAASDIAKWLLSQTARR